MRKEISFKMVLNIYWTLIFKRVDFLMKKKYGILNTIR